MFFFLSLVVMLSTSRAFCATFKHIRVASSSRRLFSIGGGSQAIPSENPVAYALGMNIASQSKAQLQRLFTASEIEELTKGFKDSLTNQFSLEEERNIIQSQASKINALVESRNSELLTKTKDAGKAFIENYLIEHPNAKKTESGLIIDFLKEGDGEKPTAASKVKVHYHGTLVDGSVFDSSVIRGEPAEFPLSAVIPGWQEGLALMPKGSKAVLIIPSDIAYGDNGSPPIAPGATIVFEVELLEIN